MEGKSNTEEEKEEKWRVQVQSAQCQDKKSEHGEDSAAQVERPKTQAPPFLVENMQKVQTLAHMQYHRACCTISAMAQAPPSVDQGERKASAKTEERVSEEAHEAAATAQWANEQERYAAQGQA